MGLPEPTQKQREVAAQWLYHLEYAKSTTGSAVFYRQLSTYERKAVDRMIREIMEAGW